MLQQFPGNIQIQIRGVHYAPDEVEALRHQIGALVHDHHAGGVQLQAALVVLGVVPAVGLGRDEQHGLVGHGTLGGHGDDAQRRVGIGKPLLVELVVLLLGDVALLPLPQGHHAVQSLPLEFLLVLRVLLSAALLQHRMGHLHADGEADIVRILLHQLVQRILPQVLAVLVLLLAVLLDVHDDVGAHRLLLAGLDGVAVHAGGLPLPRLLLPVLPGNDGDLVSHHEGGIKAHAELADDIGVRGGVAVQLLPELETAGGGDDAQIVLQLLPVHADAVIADGQQTLLLVQHQLDGKLVPANAHLIVGEAEIAQLVDGVGGVGDDLPQEDLLVGVDGVDHQIQQPFGLRLEFFSFHTGHSFALISLHSVSGRCAAHLPVVYGLRSVNLSGLPASPRRTAPPRRRTRS